MLIYVVNESPFETDDVFRYTPHNFSDEVTKMRCEMKYPDRLSDIHPSHNLADEVTKMRYEMKYPDRLSDISPILSDEGAKMIPHSIFSKHIFAEKVTSFPP